MCFAWWCPGIGDGENALDEGRAGEWGQRESWVLRVQDDDRAAIFRGSDIEKVWWCRVEQGDKREAGSCVRCCGVWWLTVNLRGPPNAGVPRVCSSSIKFGVALLLLHPLRALPGPRRLAAGTPDQVPADRCSGVPQRTSHRLLGSALNATVPKMIPAQALPRLCQPRRLQMPGNSLVHQPTNGPP